MEQYAMELSTGQKAFIDSILVDFLVFPTDAVELIKTVEKLNEACTRDVAATHEFHLLGGCLKKPEAYFRQLETQYDNPILLGHVRHFIISRLTNALNQA